MKKRLNALVGRSALVVVGVMSFVASAADNIVFPNADSSGDIASLAAWNRAELPGTSNVLFSASGTFTATEDVAFNGFMPNANNLAITFDMSPEASGATPSSPRKVTVGSQGFFNNDKTKSNITFTGGFWDFQNVGAISQYRKSYGGDDDSLTFTDVTITNLLDLKGGYGGARHRITVGAGAKIYAAQCQLDGYQSSSSTFEVKDGGLLHVNTSVGSGVGFVIGRANANAGGRNTLRVSGEGSKLIIEGSGQISMPSGNVATGNLFHVTDGAYAKISTSGYKFIGGQAAAKLGVSATWRVDDGGALDTSGTTLCLGIGGGFARMEVLEGGAWTNTARLAMGSEYNCYGNNQLIVSNGLYHGKFPVIGYYGEQISNNLLQVMGPNARFEITSFDSAPGTDTLKLFPKSHGNRVVISDGASWTNLVLGKDLHFSGQNVGCSNIFAIVRNATYYSTNKLYLADANYAVRSNTLVVADGSLFHALAICSSSIRNGIMVSNAVIETEAEIAFSQSSNSTQIHGYSNCWMRVQGTRPRANVGTDLTVLNSSYLHFDLPVEGYDAGIVPITCGTTFKVEDKSRIYVNGVEAMAAAAKRPHDVVLLEAEGGITLANGVLAAANAHIAAQAVKCVGSMLRLSGDSKKLVLHVSYPNGTTIMIK